MSGMDEKQEYAIKVMLDDITFMLYDLECGGFIKIEDKFDISNFTVSYKRILIEETEQNGYITTISDFYICVNQKLVDGIGNEIVKFETRGALRKFTLFTVDGFVCGMFMNELEKHRKQMFSINN